MKGKWLCYRCKKNYVNIPNPNRSGHFSASSLTCDECHKIKYDAAGNKYVDGVLEKVLS